MKELEMLLSSPQYFRSSRPPPQFCLNNMNALYYSLSVGLVVRSVSMCVQYRGCQQ